MLEGWAIVALALGYIGVLFGIAWIGDGIIRSRKGDGGRPLIYALSLAVYCTSWTFFGSVGLAASTGYDFLPVYLGPILMFTLGTPLILRVVRLAKSQNFTSVADFLAGRYGRSPAVAAVVTIVAVTGTLPYIALQLKAIVISTETLLGSSAVQPISLPAIGIVETPLIATLALAAFAILFGTRHNDATEHQDGLMLAIAAESLVKLTAFLAVGAFVMFHVLGGIEGFAARLATSADLLAIFGRSFHGGTWLTVTLLSSIAILLLPRQFHVTVVENHSEREIRRASWLFPLYLVLINIFVVPIAAAGLLLLPEGLVSADMYVLALPISQGAGTMTAIAYIGGLSAATAMVIVESIALAIMVCNGLVIPMLLRQRFAASQAPGDMASLLLFIRRTAIIIILLLGWVVYHALGQVHGLATIGLVSFAAIAQLAPAFVCGLFWRKGTARGAIAGILAGFVVWAYTLVVPWVVKAGWMPHELLADGLFSLAFLRPQSLFFLEFEPLTHGVLWSLLSNVVAYVTVSLLRPPEPIERLQAHIFVQDDPPRTLPGTAFRLWRTSITIGELKAAVARYLGAERAERSFAEYAASRDTVLSTSAEADIQILRFTEHLLTSAIGAASSRLVLSLMLRRSNLGSQSALRLLDDASEALQYNRDLLQSAIDQVGQGLSVFDKDMRLICWNRQFRELLSLPAKIGRVGVPLHSVLHVLAERGDFGKGSVDELVSCRIVKLTVTKETFQERLRESQRILEIRTAPMPQGGIVTTYTDITERVAAANELARANETLERRVRERTAELLNVNQALAEAKAKADAANLDKTRFLAAASHDILQPLNAARLYATSLVDCNAAAKEAQLARNIDGSLQAVEEILGALIEISRMDTGRVEPDVTDVSLQGLFDQLDVEFAPLARENGLDLRIVPTSLWVQTDRRLLRRVLQNLVSNAVKYTRRGGVLLGIRRVGTSVRIDVIDTGPGIPKPKHQAIFKEFERLESTASKVRGLGLGLSIVERICKVLNAPIAVKSASGKGSTFSVTLPRGSPQTLSPARPIAMPAVSMTGFVALCIDNEPAVLAGMKALLEGWGCRVLSAGDGGSAVGVIRASSVVPDAILVDFHLDHGTGLDALTEVRDAFGKHIPAVVITADHTPEVERDVRRSGSVLLRKPLKAAALRAVLTQQMIRAAAE